MQPCPNLMVSATKCEGENVLFLYETGILRFTANTVAECYEMQKHGRWISAPISPELPRPLTDADNNNC
jgi:hypothetical protein